MWDKILRVRTITADKGFDRTDLRDELRMNDNRPVIKHCEYDGPDRAHNQRLYDDNSHHRFVVESVFATLEQYHGDRLSARSWYGQFRELAIKAAVKNIDSGIGTSHHWARACQHV